MFRDLKTESHLHGWNFEFTVRREFATQYRYDPRLIYCLLTGKHIGELTADEFDSAVLTCTSYDDLRLRVIAAMRPGLKWNKLATQSLASMRNDHPVECMAYLVNRLFQAPPERKADMWNEREARIWTYSALSIFYSQYRGGIESTANSLWDKAMLMLLELDAKLGLANESSPFNITDLANIPVQDLMAEFVRLLAPFATKRLRYHAERESDAIYFATHPWAKRAYFDAWMETKPESKSTAEKRQRQERDSIFDIAIKAALNGSQPADDKPVAKPIPSAGYNGMTRMPKFGAKS